MPAVGQPSNFALGSWHGARCRAGRDVALQLGGKPGAGARPQLRRHRSGTGRIRGLNIRDTCKDVVEFDGETRIQWGNCGWKYWVGGSDFKPSRRGYIAVQHSLELPHLYVDSGSTGALSALNVTSHVLTFVGGFSSEAPSESSPAARFMSDGERLPTPRDARYGSTHSAGTPWRPRLCSRRRCWIS